MDEGRKREQQKIGKKYIDVKNGMRGWDEKIASELD
jgi:hypothetical protein